MFEAFAIHVIQASASLEQARLLLRLSWKSVQRIIDEAVERGLVKRDMDEIRFICMDEKSFRRGHNESAVMTDIEQSRVLEVSPGRTEESMDQLWLFHSENPSDMRKIKFKRLQQMELKTSRVWAMKEQFRWFWNYRYAGSAKRFFDKWYDWAIRSRLEPVKKVAVRFKRHLPHILNWFKHRITTGPAEGFNSRIQSTKSAARGFRNFENYRSRILFFCGKLDLLPNSSH